MIDNLSVVVARGVGADAVMAPEMDGLRQALRAQNCSPSPSHMVKHLLYVYRVLLNRALAAAPRPA